MYNRLVNRDNISSVTREKLMLIYARIKEATDDHFVGHLFLSHEEYFKATFSPIIEHDAIIFSIRGNSYKERKEYCRELAIDFSLFLESGLSYGELAIIQNWFYTNGKRYGLLTEFRENAVI